MIYLCIYIYTHIVTCIYHHRAIEVGKIFCRETSSRVASHGEKRHSFPAALGFQPSSAEPWTDPSQVFWQLGSKIHLLRS